jgi:hypothetical protein
MMVSHTSKVIPKNKFGPIPHFSRVYEVKVNANTQVLGCSCCNQERMGMPCHHIASVCHDNATSLGRDPKGFPLSSVLIFWWNQYYLYGMSNKKDHEKSKPALMALASDDTSGLPCPRMRDSPTTFACPGHVFKSYHRPATYHLLNYNSNVAIGAEMSMRGRNNTNHFPGWVME